jgi:hypothetical protein
MRVLVACEFSGRVRSAFRAIGFDAWSCDIIPAEDSQEFHIQQPVQQVLDSSWDLMIAHPPCRFLATSNSSQFKLRVKEQADALAFVKLLLNAPIRRIALENPRGVISTYIRKPNQVIQPWWFGDAEKKSTGLWLKNLPRLRATKIVRNAKSSIHEECESAARTKNRSRTFPGIAEAMAIQWGRDLKWPTS